MDDQTLGYLMLTALFGAPILFAVRAYAKTPPTQTSPAGDMHCMTCGEDSEPIAPNKAKRGNTTLEIVLWVFLLWPIALVYSVWRRIGSGAKPCCPECSASTLVPAASPAARAHKRMLERHQGLST